MEIKDIEKQAIENKTGLQEMKIRLLALEEILTMEGVIVKQDIDEKEKEIINRVKNNKQ